MSMMELFKYLEMRQPVPSGWCAFPETDNPGRSHLRCQENGHGNDAVPSKAFSPCPCHCHLGEVYECECGGQIAEAPVLGEDADGDPIYVHINEQGNMTMEGCRRA